jgi:hypothetical protein
MNINAGLKSLFLTMKPITTGTQIDVRPAERREHEAHLGRIELQILADRSRGDRQIAAVEIRDDHGDEQHRKQAMAFAGRLRAHVNVGCLHGGKPPDLFLSTAGEDETQTARSRNAARRQHSA